MSATGNFNKRFVFIRHAQSKANANQIHTPDEIINCKITELGKKQAAQLNFSFDLLIISPLKRAIETYAHSNIKVKKVIISDLFQELKVHQCNMLDNDDHNGFESMEEIEIRSKNAYDFLMSIPDEYKHIGIISHHDFLNIFFNKNLGLNVSLNNCNAFYIEK